ncbi:MAG: hypothetical protein WCL29_07485 [Pseudomonadota bacterium]
MKKIQSGILGLLSVCVFSACTLDGTTSIIKPAPVSSPSLRASPIEDAVLELRAFQGMTANELTAAKEAAHDAYERDPALFRRLRFAMTLYVSPANAADDERLLTLVEPLVATGNDQETATRVFAQMMLHTASSRKKLREEIAILRSRSASVAAAYRRDEREPEMRTLRARIDDLEKQLAAMKSIDRSVTRR